MIDSIRDSAVRALRARRHSLPSLSDWQHTIGHGKGKRARHVWDFTCPGCLRSVRIDSKPPANGIDVSGDALAVDCDSRGGLDALA